MADDLLGDLRYCAHIHEGRSRHECIGQAAELLEAQSDEIERLREENAALHEAFRQSMWHDTLIPIAEALGVSIVDEHGENRRQFQMVEAIIEKIDHEYN